MSLNSYCYDIVTSLLRSKVQSIVCLRLLDWSQQILIPLPSLKHKVCATSWPMHKSNTSISRLFLLKSSHLQIHSKIHVSQRRVGCLMKDLFCFLSNSFQNHQHNTPMAKAARSQIWCVQMPRMPIWCERGDYGRCRKPELLSNATGIWALLFCLITLL